MNKNSGVTLVVLVITIIVLLILSGVILSLTLGENGILTRTEQASKEHNKEEATEIINLKITSLQMQTYTKEQRLPNLQELSDALCEDNEIEYVKAKESQIASIEKINIGNSTSIYTKLKKYPYKFEIDSKLRLSSIDDIKVADTTNTEDLKALIVI